MSRLASRRDRRRRHKRRPKRILQGMASLLFCGRCGAQIHKHSADRCERCSEESPPAPETTHDRG